VEQEVGGSSPPNCTNKINTLPDNRPIIKFASAMFLQCATWSTLQNDAGAVDYADHSHTLSLFNAGQAKEAS
jgi:hypothetical protein